MRRVLTQSLLFVPVATALWALLPLVATQQLGLGAGGYGLLLGAIEVLSVAYLASSYRDAFVFGVMILILLFRPQGLFGVGRVDR